jgi:hypothetical protein
MKKYIFEIVVYTYTKILTWLIFYINFSPCVCALSNASLVFVTYLHMNGLDNDLEWWYHVAEKLNTINL